MIKLPPDTYRQLVWFLFIINIINIVGDYLFAWFKVPTPPNLNGLAHVALGGLLSILVSPESRAAVHDTPPIVVQSVAAPQVINTTAEETHDPVV